MASQLLSLDGEVRMKLSVLREKIPAHLGCSVTRCANSGDHWQRMYSSGGKPNRGTPNRQSSSQLRRYGRQAGGILATVLLLLLLQSLRGCMNGWDGEAEGVA